MRDALALERHRPHRTALVRLPGKEGAEVTPSRIEDVAQVLARYPNGTTYTRIQELTGISEDAAPHYVKLLVKAGRATRKVDRSKGDGERTTISLTPAERECHAQQEAKATPAHLRSLSGEARTAAKILASLQHKTPKHLAAAGNYTYPRAAELFAEIMAAQ